MKSEAGIVVMVLLAFLALVYAGSQASAPRTDPWAESHANALRLREQTTREYEQRKRAAARKLEMVNAQAAEMREEPAYVRPRASKPEATLKPGQKMLSGGRHVAMLHQADMEHLTDLIVQGDEVAAQKFLALGMATGVAKMIDGNRAVHVLDWTFLSALRKIRVPGDPQAWWVGSGAFE